MDALSGIIQDKPSIGYAELIGSRNTNSDLDIVFIKNPAYSSGSYYLDIHKALDETEQHLHHKDKRTRLIRFSRLDHEADILSMSKYNPDKDVALHLLAHTSVAQLDNHWTPDIYQSIKASKTVLGRGENLKGNLDNLLKRDCVLEGYEHLQGKIHDMDRFNSHVPKDLLMNSSRLLLNYISKRLPDFCYVEPETETAAELQISKAANLIDYLSLP